MPILENKFEKALWSTRFIVLIAVILSIISSITLFLLGGWDIIQATILNNPYLIKISIQIMTFCLKLFHLLIYF